MTRSVTIAAGTGLVTLPNGRTYSPGETVLLTDEEYRDLSASGLAKIVDNGVVSDGGITVTRRDADTNPAADGAASAIYTNSQGRLKVAATPADYTAVTGNITANGQTVAADVSRASNVVVYCTGTFAGINCTFEASIDGGTTWFGIQAARTNANTVETTTGVLGAAPAYAWELSVNAFSHIRMRATAFTSGTQVWRIMLGAYATEPIPAIQTHPVTGSGTFTVAGTATVTPVAGTPFTLTTAATTNATSVVAAACSLAEVTLSNPTATAAYFKVYNKASAPAVGTDIPIATFAIPANSDRQIDFGPIGKRMGTGLAYAVTGAAAATDTTAAVAGIQIYGTRF